MSVILLTGAGLLTRTMQRLAVVDTGLNGENVLTMEVPKDFNGEKPEEVDRAVRADASSSSRRCPACSQVGLGSTIPLRAAGIHARRQGRDASDRAG